MKISRFPVCLLLIVLATSTFNFAAEPPKDGSAKDSKSGKKEPAKKGDDFKDYKVVYEQDFSDKNAAKDFQFSDPDAWKMGKDGDEQFLELFGKSKYKPRAGAYSPLNIALMTRHKVRDFVLDLELQQTGKEYGHRDMCVFYGFGDRAKFYYTHIASKTDDRAHNVFIVNDKPRTKISHATTAGHKWSDGGWHNVRIVRDVDSGKIEVYVDDMSKPIMKATDKTFEWGYVGIGSFDDTGRVRKMKLRAPASKEGDSKTQHFKDAK